MIVSWPETHRDWENKINLPESRAKESRKNTQKAQTEPEGAQLQLMQVNIITFYFTL